MDSDLFRYLFILAHKLEINFSIKEGLICIYSKNEIKKISYWDYLIERYNYLGINKVIFLSKDKTFLEKIALFLRIKKNTEEEKTISQAKNNEFYTKKILEKNKKFLLLLKTPRIFLKKIPLEKIVGVEFKTT